MPDIKDQTDILIQTIINSEVYTQYSKLRKTLSSDPERYNQIMRFKRQSFQLQNQVEEQNFRIELEKLYQEFDSLLSDPLVQAFLAAEQELLEIMKRISRKLYLAVPLDFEFLEMTEE